MCSQCKPQANHTLAVFVCRVAHTPSCCPALAAHSAQAGHQLLPWCRARDCGVQAEAMAQPPVTETHGKKRKVEVSICLGFAPLVIHHGAGRGHQPCCPSLFPCSSCQWREQTYHVAGKVSLLPILQPWLFKSTRVTTAPTEHRNGLPCTKPGFPEGPRCTRLLHLESSGNLIVLLNINGLVIS